MKITTINIRIEASKNEDPEVVHPVTLYRKANKEWRAIDHPPNETNIERGLFPGEIKLAHMMQELIIGKYNSGD